MGYPAGSVIPGKVISSGAANQDANVLLSTGGGLYFLQLGNTAASARFVKFYDKATSPTSADTPILTLPLPTATGASGMVFPLLAPLGFTNGIGLRITTGIADNDTGAASSGDVVVNYAVR